MDKSEIIDKAISSLKQNLRKASVAQIGGFKPPENIVSSYFGGNFVGDPSEAWPEYKGTPLLPILQIVTEELPYCHPDLARFKIVQVFVSPEFMPEDQVTGDGWLLKTYEQVNGLHRIDPPHTLELRAFPIRWNLTETEAPCWEDLHEILGPDLSSQYCSLDSNDHEYYDLFQNEAKTKVGGYPSWIQGGMRGSNVIVQIESEEKANEGIRRGLFERRGLGGGTPPAELQGTEPLGGVQG